jgi:peptidoglycan/LPS O-acetylase OafA/YrhL
MYLAILDVMRGLAALLVCLFHFSNGNPNLLRDGDPLKLLFSHGWAGVEIFFVISGFVIPLALQNQRFSRALLPNFLLRRLLRLHPAYIASIAMILLLGWLSSKAPGFQGVPLIPDPANLAAHFFYLNDILSLPWYNVVYWSLAIEIQYYLFIGLLFPYLHQCPARYRALMIVCIALPALLMPDNPALILPWLPFFSAGMLSWQLHTGSISRNLYLGALAIVMLVSLVVAGYTQAIALLFSSLFICYGTRVVSLRCFSPLKRLGVISYSLYLIHVPVGGRIINLATRLPDTLLLRYCAVVFALAVSILLAWAFWKFIERPSHEISRHTRLLVPD